MLGWHCTNELILVEQMSANLCECGGLALAGCQVSLTSSAGQGREGTAKDLWLEIRTERSLTSYHHRKTRLGKLV